MAMSSLGIFLDHNSPSSSASPFFDNLNLDVKEQPHYTYEYQEKEIGNQCVHPMNSSAEPSSNSFRHGFDLLVFCMIRWKVKFCWYESRRIQCAPHAGTATGTRRRGNWQSQIFVLRNLYKERNHQIFDRVFVFIALVSIRIVGSGRELLKVHGRRRQVHRSVSLVLFGCCGMSLLHGDIQRGAGGVCPYRETKIYFLDMEVG